MTLSEAYGQLSLPDGADVQQVHAQYQEMQHDFRLRISSSPTAILRMIYEENLRKLNEAYFLITGIDTSDAPTQVLQVAKEFLDAPTEVLEVPTELLSVPNMYEEAPTEYIQLKKEAEAIPAPKPKPQPVEKPVAPPKAAAEQEKPSPAPAKEKTVQKKSFKKELILFCLVFGITTAAAAYFSGIFSSGTDQEEPRTTTAAPVLVEVEQPTADSTLRAEAPPVIQTPEQQAEAKKPEVKAVTQKKQVAEKKEDAQPELQDPQPRDPQPQRGVQFGKLPTN